MLTALVVRGVPSCTCMCKGIQVTCSNTLLYLADCLFNDLRTTARTKKVGWNKHRHACNNCALTTLCWHSRSHKIMQITQERLIACMMQIHRIPCGASVSTNWQLHVGILNSSQACTSKSLLALAPSAVLIRTCTVHMRCAPAADGKRSSHIVCKRASAVHTSPSAASVKHNHSLWFSQLATLTWGALQLPDVSSLMKRPRMRYAMGLAQYARSTWWVTRAGSKDTEAKLTFAANNMAPPIEDVALNRE